MKLSVLTITKNNQDVLSGCLKNAKKHCFEHIIVDDFSTDKTLSIAKQHTSKVFTHKLTSFAKQRHWAANKATGDWILFLDSDERITQKGWQEIKQLMQISSHSAFRFKRLNYFSGRPIKHGGFWPDYQTRLFNKKTFKGIKGATHEQYLFDGSLGTLNHAVLHFPDRSIALGLTKSLIWTKPEAKAFVKANHPKITWWRLIKVIVWEFNFRYFKKLGFLDGYIGLVEAITQAMNKFFIYQQVWELQNQEKINTKIKALEKKLL
ncbi:glycosyltransferase family 2 protein [Patescibacteria group bacterium]